MRLQAALVKIGIGVSLSLSLLTPALASGDENCTQLMYDHGLATSAQLYCGYEYYNEEIIASGARCMALADQYGQGKPKQLKDALKEGLADFQMEYEVASNKAGICSEFADQFSMFVKP
ncbi:hypothetical protein [Psychrobacter sp. ASPA161_6]|uniref:hypothetical protein n=1 Tax=Psychrobacter sp. ASPA161_6 TaxID=3160962 RepID=UPI003F815BDE